MTAHLYIGLNSTNNRLEIAGVKLVARNVHLGENADSEGALHLKAGAELEMSGELLLGSSGDGWLTIDSGATLKSTSTSTSQRLANIAGTHAGATVRGIWELSTGRLDIGFRGSGTLTIGAGGLVDVGSAGAMVMGEQSSSTSFGTLNIGGAVVNGVATTAEAAGLINAANVRGGSVSGSGGTATINFNHTSQRHEFTNSDDEAIDLIGNTRMTVNLYSGTTVLAGNNTYKGGTQIYGGTLLANHEGAGSSTGTAAVTVHEDGTLGGIGFIDGTTTVQGTLAPGDGEEGHGILKFRGNLSLGATSKTIIRVSGTERGTEYDAFSVAGTLTLGGTLKVRLEEGFTFDGSESVLLTIFDAGSLSGPFDQLDLQESFNGTALQWDASNLYENGTLGVAAIPEPQTVVLLTGAVGMLLLNRRKIFPA
ncbi:MAG TPA: PEP-CTERM sorting domain-containing protein [Chthoniobacteraceae bacterium]|nr:PEP-CTERM sorting domain-containing protein [Chthoniobacteraceae bacterium]